LGGIARISPETADPRHIAGVASFAMNAPEGVTVVVVRTVRAGMEQASEAWLHGVAEVTARFPGRMGVTIFRPRPGSRDYTFVFRFDTVENLERWEKSSERADWLRRAEDFTERVTVHKLTGLETWFAAPGAPIAMPPRWKMVIVTWLVAFPTIQLLVATLGRALGDLHFLVAGGIVTAAMCLVMTYAAIPFATRAMRRWLYPPPPP
jgi:antibiotic biosynthesis monooxygenase (ABM) superfamily enzyme